MRYTCRLLLGMAVFATMTAGAYAQDPSSAPPPPQPTAASEQPPAAPVAPVPTVTPSAESAPALPSDADAAPDMTVVPETAPAVEPVTRAPQLVVSPAVSQAPAVVAKKKAPRSIAPKKTDVLAPKQQEDSQDKAAAAAAATVAGQTAANNPPPPGDSGGVAPQETAASLAPPPPPAAEAAPVETRTERTEAATHESRNVWLLVGVLAFVAGGMYFYLSGRRRPESLSIYDRSAQPPSSGPPVVRHF